MKSCYKSLKQLDPEKELYSGLDPILRVYFLLTLKVSFKILEKIFVGYRKGLS